MWAVPGLFPASDSLPVSMQVFLFFGTDLMEAPVEIRMPGGPVMTFNELLALLSVRGCRLLHDSRLRAIPAGPSTP